MNKNFAKFIIMICGSILFGMFFCVSLSIAAELSLEVVEDCYLQYAGDNCTAKLKLNNNTGSNLQGEIILGIQYEDADFDGVGIKSYFKINPEVEWIETAWSGVAMAGSGFDISEGISNAELKIETHSALLSGEYSFLVSIKGDSGEEEYISTPAVLSGGGGYIDPKLANPKIVPAKVSEIDEGKTGSENQSQKDADLKEKVNYFIEKISELAAASEEKQLLVDFVQNNSEVQNALIEEKIQIDDLAEALENGENLFDVLEFPEQEKVVSQNKAFLADAISKIWDIITNSWILTSALIVLICLLCYLGFKQWRKK